MWKVTAIVLSESCPRVEIIEGNIIAIRKGWAGQTGIHALLGFLGANEVSKGMASFDANE